MLNVNTPILGGLSYVTKNVTNDPGYHKITKELGTPSKQLSENTAIVHIEHSFSTLSLTFIPLFV